jgi:hypothetical protein
MIGLAAIAFAAHSMCRNPDKRTTEYQIAIGAIFVGLLCAFCGIVMMGTGMGANLFTATGARGMGMGMGGYY